jgi:hypothetical protein
LTINKFRQIIAKGHSKSDSAKKILCQLSLKNRSNPNNKRFMKRTYLELGTTPFRNQLLEEEETGQKSVGEVGAPEEAEGIVPDTDTAEEGFSEELAGEELGGEGPEV